MRRKIVAGNWKMNPDLSGVKNLIEDLKSVGNSEVESYVFPPALFLNEAQKQENHTVGAQNFYYADNGAYTGEISTSMLSSIEVQTALVGHSERRSIFGEDAKIVKEKLAKAFDAGMEVFYCIGEPLEIREAGTHEAFVLKQIEEELLPIWKEGYKLVVAYEPVWAIGTGKTATSDQAQEMHKAIRAYITEKMGAEANSTPILYGGSCKPGNAKEIFGQPDVDGGLIGGAALKANDFGAIIDSF